MPLIVFALRHVLVLAILAGTAWACGRLAMSVLRRSGYGRDERNEDVEPWPITIALGLAILAQAALLLAFAGWFRAHIVAAVAIGINVAAFDPWRQAVTHAIRRLTARDARRDTLAASPDISSAAGGAHDGLRSTSRPTAPSASPRATVVSTVAARIAVALLIVPPFLLTLYPPLGFDQTMYHLPFARAFAATGGVPFLPALRFPVFPPLAELLSAALLMFGDDVTTQMVGWLAYATCAGLVFIWTRERSSEAGGWLAVAMLAGSPIVVYLAATGYVEPVLGLFGLASLYAADRARDGRGGTGAGWIVAAALLAGSAAGVKYPGLFFVPAAALLVIDRRDAWTITLRALALYGVAALVVLAPVYGRLIASTGNPLFPFYPSIFGSSLWDAQEYLLPQGLARWRAAATFFWDITFRRHAVGGLPFWSPAFLLGVVLALFVAWRQPRLSLPSSSQPPSRPQLRPRPQPQPQAQSGPQSQPQTQPQSRPVRVRLFLSLGLVYLALSPINAHYFLAIAPLWCVLTGVAAAAIVGSSPLGQRLLIAVAVIIALGGDAYTVHRVFKLGLPPTTPEGREQLLSGELPLYQAVAALNRIDADGKAITYGVHAEQMIAYAAGTLVGDHFGPFSYTRVQARARELGSLAAELDTMRASYLLIPRAESAWIDLATADPRLSRIYSDDHAALYRVLSANLPQMASR